MRRLVLFVCLAGNCSLLAAQAPSREAGPRRARFPEGTTVASDLVYSRPARQTELCLDLARPRGNGPFPVVIFLHGGGWMFGTRKTYLPYMVGPVEAGYVAVSVSYRLAPAHQFPAAVHDVKCAVRWLRAHADKYRIDPERIGVVGYSAGGNLAALLGTTHGNAGLEGSGGCNEQSSRVQAVVSYYGLSDLRALHAECAKSKTPSPEENLMLLALQGYLGGTPARTGGAYTQASPAAHAARGSAPMQLIHGTHDRLVPPNQSQLLEAKLQQAGVEVSLLEVKGAGHNFVGEYEKEPTRVMMQFFDRHLKKNGDNPSASLTPRKTPVK